MPIASLTERRTAADAVFETLYDQIVSLEIMPGTKMSEADIATQFGVSRQPVREAFNRLGGMDLLLIQPQRATVVQKFSLSSIQTARFVRRGVELEILRSAIANWSEAHVDAFEQNLGLQEDALHNADTKAFHALDAAFHALIAEVAQQPDAYALVMQKKVMVDRICVLSLRDAKEMEVLVADHRNIFDAIVAGDAPRAEAHFRDHLGRIDKTIAAVRDSHAAYFAD